MYTYIYIYTYTTVFGNHKPRLVLQVCLSFRFFRLKRIGQRLNLSCWPCRKRLLLDIFGLVLLGMPRFHGQQLLQMCEDPKRRRGCHEAMSSRQSTWKMKTISACFLVDRSCHALVFVHARLLKSFKLLCSLLSDALTSCLLWKDCHLRRRKRITSSRPLTPFWRRWSVTWIELFTSCICSWLGSSEPVSHVQHIFERCKDLAFDYLYPSFWKTRQAYIQSDDSFDNTLWYLNFTPQFISGIESDS